MKDQMWMIDPYTLTCIRIILRGIGCEHLLEGARLVEINMNMEEKEGETNGDVM